MANVISPDDYTIVCAACGVRVFDEHASVCPSCGAPLVLSDADLHAREERERKAANEKVIGIVLAVLVVLLGLSFNFLGPMLLLR